MTINRGIITTIALIFSTLWSFAGNGINSPYSRYGLGLLADQNLGVNRQMGGLGYGLRSSSYINLLNPASISAADTLTMLFEAGFSMQNGNFEEGKVRKNARNASFDYIAMQFRLCKDLGFSLGFLPYSNVGYSFATTTKEHNIENTQAYYGEGGIYQPFVALGWKPLNNLSVGVMASYIYGDISHSISHNFSDANNTGNLKRYDINVKSYKIDLGAQYTTAINEKHNITFGTVYTLGHDLNADITLTEQESTNKADYSLKIPQTIGVGTFYDYNNNWKVGVDYTFEKWSGATFTGGDNGIDRSKISVGAEYYPNDMMSRNIFKKMHYRVGAYYAQPYTEIKGAEGCEEYGVSAGLSMPLINSRSLLHLSGQLIRMEPKTDGFISETYMRINIGITFNENWFMKLKLR